MNLINEQQCFDGFAMSKSEAITTILRALDKITMETTVSAAAAAAAANTDNNDGGWIVMTSNEKNNNGATAITTNTTNPSKPRPETTINHQSKSAAKSVVATSSREEGNNSSSSKEEESLNQRSGGSKRSMAAGIECGGALLDYKVTKVNNKLVTIHDSVCHLAAECKSLKMLMEKQEKMQRITFAIENCDYGSFEYYNSLVFCHHQSQHLVKSILFAFRQDDGYELPTECIVDESSGGRGGRYAAAEEKNMAIIGEQLFHERLVSQIHALTGIEPRIEKIDGKVIVWYS
jgi:hypothetical protein